MTTLNPPVASFAELIDFFRLWHEVPDHVEKAKLPFRLPTALQQLHETFGLRATVEVPIGRPFETGYTSSGLFAVQDHLVPVSRMIENFFVAAEDHGKLAGQRLLTIIHECQWCWYMHVPLDAGTDPPVFLSETSPVNFARPVNWQPLVQVANRLSSFLAQYTLRETVLGSSLRWFRSAPFEMTDFKIPLVPLMLGEHANCAGLRNDFYIDAAERVLVMVDDRIAVTWIAARGLELGDVLVNPQTFEAY